MDGPRVTSASGSLQEPSGGPPYTLALHQEPGNKGAMAEGAKPGLWRSRAARVTLSMCCLFGTTGMIMVFLPRWLESARGLTGAEIGALIALPQMARIGIGPIVAFWADGTADRRTPLRLLSVAALVAYAVFFFLPHNFPALIALGFVALSLTAIASPFVEGAALRATANGEMPYGFSRGLGSVAFIIANVGGGLLVARFGVWAMPAWTLTSLALFALTNWFLLAPDPAPYAAHHREGGAQKAAVRALAKNRRFLILVIACGFIQSAHAFYYSFSTLVWRGQGIDAGSIGVLWSIGVGTEVAFLWTLPFFERRLAPETLILAGACGAVVRWLLMGFAPTGFVLWPLQTLHALSFAAAHVGAMRLIYREAPEAAAGMAQTLYSVLSSGVFMGMATLGSGLLYDSVGAHGYWAMSAMAAAGAGFALLLQQRRNVPQL